MREGLDNLPKHFYKDTSEKNSLGLTNSRYNELFSGSFQSSLYRDSTVDISGSLEILDKISVILRTKKYDTDASLSFSSRTSPWHSKRLH